MQLSFEIDGKWFSNYLRTLFWDDNIPFEEVEYIGLESLGLNKDSAEPIDLISGILEYRYELSGINSFELIYLSKSQYKPISDKLVKLEFENYLNKIQAEMNSNPVKYVDPYSAVMSVNPPFCIIDREYEFIIDYFSCGRTPWTNGYIQPFPNYFTSTKCGLWMLDNPQLIFDIGGYKGINSETFWEDLAKYIDEKYKDDEAFKQRNERYYAYERLKNYKYDLHFHDTSKDKEKLELFELTEPDAYESEYGLIDPEGNWYSSGFGGHEIKAEHLCISSKKSLPCINYDNLDNYINNSQNRTFTNKDWLSYLLNEENWAMFHGPIPSNGYIIQIGLDNFRLTKKQIDSIWNMIVKHEINTACIQNIDLILR